MRQATKYLALMQMAETQGYLQRKLSAATRPLQAGTLVAVQSIAQIPTLRSENIMDCRSDLRDLGAVSLGICSPP